VIEKLMMESMVDKIISSIYHDQRGTGLFLDLAAYYLITENNAGQYYPDYAYNHPLFTPEYKIYSDSTVSTFISLEYYHDGKDGQRFVCRIEKAAIIEEEMKICGYFCIITSAEMTAKEALDLYKSRDASEKLFKADKSFLGYRDPYRRIIGREDVDRLCCTDHPEPDVCDAEGCGRRNA
jgi:hypothetical protein